MRCRKINNSNKANNISFFKFINNLEITGFHENCENTHKLTSIFVLLELIPWAEILFDCLTMKFIIMRINFTFSGLDSIIVMNYLNLQLVFK